MYSFFLILLKLLFSAYLDLNIEKKTPKHCYYYFHNHSSINVEYPSLQIFFINRLVKKVKVQTMNEI